MEAAVKCLRCGKEFTPSGHGKRQKYCSQKCRDAAAYERRRKGVKAPPEKPYKTKAAALAEVREITSADFDRMMDKPREEILRGIVSRLERALNDPDTPANALPSISAELRRASAELDGLKASEDDALADLTAAVEPVAFDTADI